VCIYILCFLVELIYNSVAISTARRGVHISGVTFLSAVNSLFSNLVNAWRCIMCVVACHSLCPLAVFHVIYYL